jgi:hypothetical protein
MCPSSTSGLLRPCEVRSSEFFPEAQPTPNVRAQNFLRAKPVDHLPSDLSTDALFHRSISVILGCTSNLSVYKPIGTKVPRHLVTYEESIMKVVG